MLLELSDVTIRYESTPALKGMSLNVEEGEIVTLLGANGAGKTTTLRAISGLVRPSGGSLHFDGHDLSVLAPHQIVALGIGHAPEGRRIFARMSVVETSRWVPTRNGGLGEGHANASSTCSPNWQIAVVNWAGPSREASSRCSR